MFGMFLCEVCGHVASVASAATVHAQAIHGASIEFGDMYWTDRPTEAEAADALAKAEAAYRAEPSNETSTRLTITRRAYSALPVHS